MPWTPSQCCTRNVVWKPMNSNQKCTFPSRSSSIQQVVPAAEVEAGEHREHDRAEDNVVEVGQPTK